MIGLFTVAPFVADGVGCCAVTIPDTPSQVAALPSALLLTNWLAATWLGNAGTVMVAGAKPVIPAPLGAGRLFRLSQPSKAEPPRVSDASTAAPRRGRAAWAIQAPRGVSASWVGRAASTALLNARYDASTCWQDPQSDR